MHCASVRPQRPFNNLLTQNQIFGQAICAKSGQIYRSTNISITAQDCLGACSPRMRCNAREINEIRGFLVCSASAPRRVYREQWAGGTPLALVDPAIYRSATYRPATSPTIPNQSD